MDDDIDRLNSIVREQLSKCKTTSGDNAADATIPNRWNTILANKNQRDMWRAINWNGNLELNETWDTPSEKDFKLHFENLLNPNHDETLDLVSSCSGPSIPITDDPITFDEIKEAAKSCNSTSSGGPSGIPCGVFKFLPDARIYIICGYCLIRLSFPDVFLWCGASVGS